jgi:hypothetical protein
MIDGNEHTVCSQHSEVNWIDVPIHITHTYIISDTILDGFGHINIKMYKTYGYRYDVMLKLQLHSFQMVLSGLISYSLLLTVLCNAYK